MAVLLGDQGKVELRRSSASRPTTFNAYIGSNDINTSKDRFGVSDLSVPVLPLITGDRIEIATFVANAFLGFIEGYTDKNKFVGYIHVDAAGGIYLFHDYVSAINNTEENRIQLIAHNQGYVNFTIQGTAYRLLGQVVSYELNTEREAVDTTALSDDFRKSTSGLISGNGRLTALFDYKRNGTDPAYRGVDEALLEMPFFISQLVLRTELGSEFHGKFTVVSEGNKAYGQQGSDNDEIWYECDARVTSAAMDFTSSEAVELAIEFVTTGTIELKTQLDEGNKITTTTGDALQLGLYQDTGDGVLTTNI